MALPPRGRRTTGTCCVDSPGSRKSSLEGMQPISDAAHSLQRARAVAELAPQAGHRHLHHVRAARPLVAPDVAQERLAGDRLAAAVVEVAQDVALELGERDPAV